MDWSNPTASNGCQRHAGNGCGGAFRLHRGAALARKQSPVEPGERKKLRRENPRSGCPEKSGHTGRAMNPPRASKRRRRLVRTGAFTPRTRALEHAVGTRNLTKAVAGSQGTPRSFGSYSAGGLKSKRGTPARKLRGRPSLRNTSRWDAGNRTTAKRDRPSHTAIPAAANSEGQAKLQERRAHDGNVGRQPG